MKLITQEDIEGAMITDIYSKYEDLDEYGCSCAQVYFKVDRGFTFQLPTPGLEWSAVEISERIETLPDAYWEESYTVKETWFGRKKFTKEPSRKIDTVRRIKERKIIGVYCPEMNEEELECYESDESFLILDDGSRVYCKTIAPNGIGVGLIYRDDIKALAKLEKPVNYFDPSLQEFRDSIDKSTEQ